MIIICIILLIIGILFVFAAIGAHIQDKTPSD
jgi:hypothetical protein